MNLVLELDNVHYTYAETGQVVLRGVSLQLYAGQRVALIGRNGSGKSTLLLHCNGILRPQQGQIRVHGQVMSYTGPDIRLWRRQVGVIFQHADDQLFSANVAQDISFGLLNLGWTEATARARVAEVAAQCGVTHLLDRPIHALSGGEKARVALAGVLAMEPAVLIGDECLAALDPWMRQQLLGLFTDLATQGISILLATHDLHLAQTWAQRVVVLEQGTVVADLAAAQLFRDPRWLARTQLDQVL